MPIPKGKQELYGKVIGSCINQGGSKEKCKDRAERAVMSKKSTPKKKVVAKKTTAKKKK